MTISAGALQVLDILATVTGAAYAILAARRNRLCWWFGALSSACATLLASQSQLPMQALLQLFFVFTAVYGWTSWTRSTTGGELDVGLWPVRWHAGAGLAMLLLSLLTAQWLAANHASAWPLFDSLATWFSLLATWLAVRGRIENWLYWIPIDAVQVFLYYVQERPWFALLNLAFIGIAAAGFVAWRRRLHAQAVPA